MRTRDHGCKPIEQGFPHAIRRWTQIFYIWHFQTPTSPFTGNNSHKTWLHLCFTSHYANICRYFSEMTLCSIFLKKASLKPVPVFLKASLIYSSVKKN